MGRTFYLSSYIMDRHIHFLVGLPRSGSTVLSKILNQHPNIFVSPTSPFLDFYHRSLKALEDIEKSHSAGYVIDKQTVLFNTAFSFYNRNKPHLIEKNRDWINHYKSVNLNLQKDAKFIMTIRPIEEVITSFYKLIVLKNRRKEDIDSLFEIYVKKDYNNLLKHSHLKEHLCIVTYKDILENNTQTMKKIETYLKVKHHDYDLYNIEDETPENDEKWGITGLHDVRTTLSDQSLPPYEIMNTDHLDRYKSMTEKLYNAYGVNL